MEKNKVNNADIKFKESQLKLQQAVEKFAYDCDTSEDEDELESEHVIDITLQNYSTGPESRELLGNTKYFLEEAFQSGAVTCLICISTIRRSDPIWSCLKCFCMFHLLCVQRWARDTIFQRKQALEDSGQTKKLALCWCCPKCRHEYSPDNIPGEYYCFCKKRSNPVYIPLLIPHSCGERCDKELVPCCGHRCMLLCHPGPCPPCPQMVESNCHCCHSEPITKRCCDKEWSCGKPCDKLLPCGKHKCASVCHAGDCDPCKKKSLQKCLCGSEIQMKDCSDPNWQCSKVCDKPLSCGYHKCQEVCHKGECVDCDSSGRYCPCGKTKFEAPCYEEAPCCEETCEKLLECGKHTCEQLCHRGKCDSCVETVTKTCRCGLFSKEVQCKKEYLCETKCKQMKDCNKHPCNKKCCNGNCAPCEKTCGRTLSCKKHTCSSVCHQGPCYPCALFETVSCRCATANITVPCGKKKRTKPPRCSKLCDIPSDCNHKTREPHRCHYGNCPTCKQICGKSYSECTHTCTEPCHTKIVRIEKGKKGKKEVHIEEIDDNSCPPCSTPVMVTCLGAHETRQWPCHQSKPSSCFRECGTQLPCENHRCQQPCHTIDTIEGNCDVCESGCVKPRPIGCVHACLKPCHPGKCPPCKQMSKVRCHCGLTQLYIECAEWTSKEDKDALKCCKNQCPKNYPCGHRCKSNCHSGDCPNPEACSKKVKIACPCKRIKKDVPCEAVRKQNLAIECNDACKEKQEAEQKVQEAQRLEKEREEEKKNQIELEKYNRLFSKKKHKQKRHVEVIEKQSWIKKYYMWIAFLVCVMASFYTFCM